MAEVDNSIQQEMQILSQKGVQIANEHFDMALDYSLSSLTHLDRLLEQARQSYLSKKPTENGLEFTIQIWGAYLGETLRRNKGGIWKKNPGVEGDRYISITTSKGIIYPFEQVRHRIIPGGTQPSIGTPSGNEQLKTNSSSKSPKPASNWLLRLGTIWLRIVIVVFLVAIIGTIIHNHQQALLAKQRAAYEEQFLPYMDVYLYPYPLALGDDSGYFSGKILVINPDTKKVADLHFMLPEEMQASNPEDVNIIIRESCGIAESGYYVGTSIFNSRVECNLVLVNMSLQKVIAKQQFLGSEMVEEIHVGKAGFPVKDLGGDLDKEQIVRWLKTRFNY